MAKTFNIKRIGSLGFGVNTCNALFNLQRKKLVEVYFTLWSVLSEKNKCKMPASVPSGYRDPNICVEMKMA